MDNWDDADGGGNPPSHAPTSHPMGFEELVHTYHDQLLSRARGLCADEGMAEDAVQETLLRAWQALPTLPPDANLGGWLHRVLTNITIDQHRRSERELRRVAAVAGVDAAARTVMPDHGPSVDDRLAVHDALSSLGAGHREALLMRDMAGHEYDAIATTSGTTAINVRARVHRARTAMRTQLMASGVRRVSLVTILLAIAIALVLWWFTSRIGHDDSQRPPGRGPALERTPDPPGAVDPSGARPGTTTPSGGGTPSFDEDRVGGTSPRGRTSRGGSATSPAGTGTAGFAPEDERGGVTAPTTPDTTTTTCDRCFDRPASGTLHGVYETPLWEGREAPTAFRAQGDGGLYHPDQRQRELHGVDTVLVRRFALADDGISFTADLLASGPTGPIWMYAWGSAVPLEGRDGHVLRGDFTLRSGGQLLPFTGQLALSLRFPIRPDVRSRARVPEAEGARPMRLGGTPSIRPPRLEFGPGSISVDAFDDLDQDGIRSRGELGIAGSGAVALWYGRDGLPETDDDQGFLLVEGPEGHHLAEGLPLGTYRLEESLPSGWVILGQGINDGPTRRTVVTLSAQDPDLAVDLPGVLVSSIAGAVQFEHPLAPGFQTPVDGIPVTVTNAGPDGRLDTPDDQTTATQTDELGRWQYETLHRNLVRVRLGIDDGWAVVRDPRGLPHDGSFELAMSRGAAEKDLDFAVSGTASAQMSVQPAPGFTLPTEIDLAVLAWGTDGRLGTADDIALVIRAPLSGGRAILPALPPGRISILLDRTALGSAGSQVTRPEEALLTVEVPPGGTVGVPFGLRAE